MLNLIIAFTSATLGLLGAHLREHRAARQRLKSRLKRLAHPPNTT